MDSNSPSSPIFAGSVRHALDSKNRVTIPSRWRRGDPDEFYAVSDPREPVVLLFLEEELRSMSRKIEDLPEVNAGRKRALTRQLFASAFPCPVDKQGRIVLPSEICERLGLRGDVVLSGGGNRIEVRHPDAWRQVCENEKDAFVQGAQELGL